MRKVAVVIMTALALSGCISLEPPRPDCAGGPVRVSGDARQGVVFAEGAGARLDGRTRVGFDFGACG